MLFARQYHFTQSKNITRTFDLKLNSGIIKPTAQGGLLGYLIGFMPGPAAMMSSILAYKWPKRSTSEGIVRSESANNAAVVAETIPFMGLGIPINTTAVLVYSILTMKLVSWPSAVYTPSLLGLPVYSVVFALAIVATTIFFFLSTRFLDRYCQLLDHMGTKITWLWTALVTAMIAIDLMINVLDWRYYFIWMLTMVSVGYLLYRTRVSGVALIFGYVLGDKMIWAAMQTMEYYS
jgi:putative tricarboxylic transport membrane protein